MKLKRVMHELCFVFAVVFLSVFILGGSTEVINAETWILITDANGLSDIRNNPSANYRLSNNIDLTGIEWVPIPSFTGVLDGNGKIIKNLKISNTTLENAGLFAITAQDAQIFKLGFEEANITAGSNTGILAGINNAYVSQVYTRGSVLGENNVGGLIGSNGNTGVIDHSYSAASVSGKDNVGGLVGANSGIIDSTYAVSKVDGSLFNNYIQFNGSNGYISIPHREEYVTGTFTLEAWFQWEDINKPLGTDPNAYVDFIIGKGVEQFEIHTEGGSGRNGVRFIPIPRGATGDSYLDIKDVLRPGWFHVAAVYSYDEIAKEARASFYVNGVAQDIYINGDNVGKVATISRPTPPLISTSAINIGRRTDGSYPFNGKIADVRFWNTERTADEIIANKNKQLTGSEPGLIGYWKLDEPVGTTIAYDSCNNLPSKNNGTLMGGVTRVRTENNNVGGLVGSNSGSVLKSYYNADVFNKTNNGIGTSMSAEDMRQMSKYDSWSTLIWSIHSNINDGYPYLTAVLNANKAPIVTDVQALGTAKVGQILTAGYNYYDYDGDLQGATTFRWFRSDNASGEGKTQIGGALSRTYTITASDQGKYISVEVKPVAQTGQTHGGAVESLSFGPIIVAPLWVQKPSVTMESISDVAYGDNRFVAVSNNGQIIESLDNGQTWEVKATLGAYLGNIAYGNGTFVAAESGFGEAIHFRKDGIETWTKVLVGNHPDGRTITGIVYGDQGFVATGMNGYYSTIYHSVDGVTWTEVFEESNIGESGLFILGVGYGDGTYLAVGTNGRIFTSENAVEWQFRGSADTGVTLNTVAYGNGRFVVAGVDKCIYVSDNHGETWSLVHTTEKWINDIGYANGYFYAVGANGLILYSADGTLWTEEDAITFLGFNGITYGIGYYVTVGNEGTIYTKEAPLMNSAPTLTNVQTSGTLQLGHTLTGHYTYSDADGDAAGTITGKWYRSDDAAGTNKLQIQGATGNTYTLKAQDVGKYISFSVTPVSLTGMSPGMMQSSAILGPVEKGNQGQILYSNVVKTYGDTPFTHGASGGSGNGIFSYLSSDPTVATIDPLTGDVTLLKAGTTQLTATKAGDESYLSASNTCTLTILPKTLVATATVDDKIYDGTPAATGEILLEGVLEGDVVSAEGTFKYIDSSVGENKVVNVTDILLKGADAGNYSLIENTLTVTASILPAQNNPPNTGSEVLNPPAPNNEVVAQTTREVVRNQSVTTVLIDDEKIDEKLRKEGENAVISIPVQRDSDVVVGQLNGQTIKNMEESAAILKIQTENVTYTLPAMEINIDAVSEQIGEVVQLQDIIVNIRVAQAEETTAKIVEDTANKNQYQIVVKPVEFEITCSYGDRTIEVTRFNAYVERVVAIPQGIDPARITTGITLNTDGTFSHVPTSIVVVGGKYYAKINSLTNSTYSVIWSPKTFEDIEHHWAKEAINDMGSRLVINGVDAQQYQPDRHMTRAEFVNILIKAFGLMRPGTGKDYFNDVTSDAWYNDGVAIAHDYGITLGYGNEQFKPDKDISRDEFKVMIARMLRITGLESVITEEELNTILDESNPLATKNHESITRAEVAVIIRTILQEANLI